jgi:putative transposase
MLLKGKRSLKLMMEYTSISRGFWGRHMWAREYLVASSGNITDEVIVKYIEQQSQEPPEGDFKIDDELQSDSSRSQS